jgi:carboxypeptidase Q
MDFSAFWQGNIFENLQRQKEYTEVKKLADKAEEQKDSIYTALETLCICFPGRISGSDALESSLDYLFEWGIRNLHGCSRMTQEEVCDIPVWQRGDPDMEKLQLIIQPGENVWPVPNPLNRRLGVLAIGMSIGTSKSGVQGDISIVADFDELATRGRNGELKGKIVLLDYRKFRTYGDHAALRACGANEATRYGALAVLIRSLTPNDSVSGIHTGSQSRYDESAGKPIPAGCISVEDTELCRRLCERGHRLSATLSLPCRMRKQRDSRNLCFEIPGTEVPNEVILFGAHTDCWDCQHSACQGAHDDGQGVSTELSFFLS